jgi:hypothetical protein
MDTHKHPHPITPRRLTRLPEEPTRSEYLWCLICERAYSRRRGARDEAQLCPYDDCKGRTVFYSWDWNRTRKVNPNYPNEPRLGQVYPLFGRPPVSEDH